MRSLSKRLIATMRRAVEWGDRRVPAGVRSVLGVLLMVEDVAADAQHQRPMSPHQCRECQFITGGSPNMFVVMPLDGFKYTKGAPKQFSRRDLEKPVTREFCAECGTHMVTRPQRPIVVVKVGTLDNPAQIAPQIAIYTVDKQPFHHIPEGMPSFERLPQR
jgi:hypothetical protein